MSIRKRPPQGRGKPGKSIRKPSALRGTKARAVNTPVRGLPPRPQTNRVKAGTNLRRAEQRALRRQAARRVATRPQPQRPRPAARPSSPPKRVMPRMPAPRPAQLRTIRKGHRPVAARRTVSAAARGADAVAAAGFLALNAAAAPADISPEIQTLQHSLDDLRSRSSFSQLQADLTNLDAALNRVVALLESARAKDYKYQGDLEDHVYEAVNQWEAIRSQVEQGIQEQARAMQPRLSALDAQLQRLNANIYSTTAAAPHLRSVQNQANSLLGDVNRIENDLERSYAEIESQVYAATARLNDIHWALDQLQAARFTLDQGEDLVMAVPARWDQEGKDDPEGVLYLSNKRLIFERKEKVATKKILFITTASELVQEVLIAEPLTALEQVKAENKGLFGHQDFLQVGFKNKEIGTVDFHLNGQDSEDWAALVYSAQTGELEDEKVSGGAGISVADLSGPLTAADIMKLQSDVNALQDEVMLQDARAELADLENEVRLMERRLAEVRARGYQIEKGLEADIQVLSAQWERVKSNAEATIHYQANLLGERMNTIQQDLARLAGMTSNLAAARPLYMQIKSAMASAEGGRGGRHGFCPV